ncbi:FMN-binding protein [Actinoplanes utahensis]|uniref:Peptidase n=1 Tax=Actinoplanes utahensis TaxID=1869 RepID=A0A0A6X732_ACTUT|nr:FMN-binding protein [Actinoplanes utahensis]KHD75942.1 peptidase [Actinoplanes utahensis]GIF35045.1 hypothetical protein Aut01nite_80310 [Actinoplanes utahensis]
MRRSTAAALGTLTGAALILGVRLSVQPAAVPVAAAANGAAAEEPEIDEAGADATAPPAGKKPAGGKKTTAPAAPAGGKTAEAEEAGLKAGTYKGKAVQNPYGTVQVTIKISGGKISSANATAPTDGFSGTINPKAVEKLNASALKAQSADVDAVSGATFTSQSYSQSLQAALDKAGA